MSYLAAGSFTVAEYETWGRTGKSPASGDMFGSRGSVTLASGLNDKTKKAAYESGKRASLSIARSKSETETNKAQVEALKSGKTLEAAAPTLLGMPRMTAIMIGVGLAGLATVLVLKKKGKATSAPAAVTVPVIR